MSCFDNFSSLLCQQSRCCRPRTPSADHLLKNDNTNYQSNAESQQDSSDKPSLSILITGKCGSGKSALINALLGEILVPERSGVHEKSRSPELLTFTSNKNQFKVTVWVSSQLQHRDFSDEAVYLTGLEKQCGNVDLIVYCLKMTESRFMAGNPDEWAMENIFRTLGPQSLKKTIFALTFANNSASSLKESEIFQHKVSRWTQLITDSVTRLKIPWYSVKTIPVGYCTQLSLPNCNNWLEDMWCNSLEVMPDQAKAMMAANNQRRFEFRDEGEDATASNPSLLPIVFSTQEKMDHYSALANKSSLNIAKDISQSSENLDIGEATRNPDTGEPPRTTDIGDPPRTTDIGDPPHTTDIRDPPRTTDIGDPSHTADTGKSPHTEKPIHTANTREYTDKPPPNVAAGASSKDHKDTAKH